MFESTTVQERVDSLGAAALLTDGVEPMGGLGAPDPLAGVVDPLGGLGAPVGLTVGADRLGVLGAAGFLLEAVEGLAELPSQLWRTGNDGFAGIAAAMDALAVQLGCARVGLVGQAESRGVVDESALPSGAVLTAALDPFSAPRPCGAGGGRDLRPADRRRAEALIEVCRRATAAGGAAPATTKAQVVVLIDYDVLAGGVRGAGTTLTGQVLSPGTVRRMGCDAQLIPAVLGGAGQPLDVGRWACLTNLTLLCGYHHSYVHRRDLTATVTAHDVTWHT